MTVFNGSALGKLSSSRQGKFVRCSQQVGLSFIEVLVAALILGVGMLGVLGMQTQAVQYSHQAYLYSQAMFLADSMADKMRVNRTAASSYLLGFGASSTSNIDCVKNLCNQEGIAAWDKAQWIESVEALLPQGQGEIALVSGTESTYTIRVRFTDKRLENSGSDSQATVNVSVQL